MLNIRSNNLIGISLKLNIEKINRYCFDSARLAADRLRADDFSGCGV